VSAGATAPAFDAKTKVKEIVTGLSEAAEKASKKFSNSTNAHVLPAAEKAAKQAAEGVFKTAEDLAKKGGVALTPEQLEQTAAKASKAATKAFNRTATELFSKAGYVWPTIKQTGHTFVDATKRLGTMLGIGRDTSNMKPNFFQKSASAPMKWANSVMKTKAGPLVVAGAGLAAIAAGVGLMRSGQEQKAYENQAATQDALMQSMQPSYKNSVTPQEAAMLEERQRMGGGGMSQADAEMARRSAAAASTVPAGTI